MNTIKDLDRIREGRTGRCSSWDTSGRNSDWWLIPAGQSRVLADIKGPGVITHIWMTQMAGYRDCLIKITWDNNRFPSILCPLGDFFGLGHCLVNSYQSMLFTASTNVNYQFNAGCALNCYAPMAFRRRAVVELVNEGKTDQGQYFYIDYERVPLRELTGRGYFHAEFRCARPFGGWAPEMPPCEYSDIANKERLAWNNNYVILDTKGCGHYIGCNLSITNLEGQGSWWGEGDDMIWVDGYKWPPDLHGTGSEDYLNQAWGMQPNAFLRNGSSIHESVLGDYQTSYVHHIENPVRFRKSIKVTIEAGTGNHQANDLCSVAYWYSAKPVSVQPPPPAAQRQPLIRNSDGLFDVSSGKPFKLNDEMRQCKKGWAETGRSLSVRARPAPRWVDRWMISKLLPKNKSVANAKPVALGNRTLDWTPIEASGHFVNVTTRYGGADGIVYLGNRFRLKKATEFWINFGHDGGAALFVNGRRLSLDPHRINPAKPDRARVLASLRKGVNEVVVALDTDYGLGQGIFFSFATLMADLPPGQKPGFPEICPATE